MLGGFVAATLAMPALAQTMSESMSEPTADLATELATGEEAGNETSDDWRLRWSASLDGITEDVPFSPNINFCDGFQFIRFHTLMRSNLITGGRPFIDKLEIPFTFD